MSAPQGRVAIEISRGDRNAYARLLTPELQQLIERQNIDCSDINCMKWPLFGLSRHATCKLLLMQRDLMDLLASDVDDWDDDTYTASNDGFRIWFVVGSKASCTRNAFLRMHIAEIKPLMLSEYGKQNFGEAFYIVTFKCDRWAARGNRFDTDYAGSILGQYWSRSWDPSAFVDSYQSADRPTVSQVVNTMVTSRLNQSSYWRMYRAGTDAYDASTVTSAAWASAEGLRGIDTMLGKPLTVAIDDIAARSGVAMLYVSAGITNSPGIYKVSAIDISAGNQRMVSFLNQYKNDIQAGSVLDIKDGTGAGTLSEIAALARIPNVVAQPIRPAKAIVGIRKNRVADGTPPDVFSQSLTTADTQGVGEFENPNLSDPFNKTIQQSPINRVAQLGYPYFGEGGSCFINADNWDNAERSERRNQSVITYGSPYSNAENIANEVALRWAGKYQSGVCDIWLRSWVMPTVEQTWPGGSWIEFRLQTDGQGFPFPTTHIYGSIDDPLLGPVADDSQHDVEGSGMVQTWRGEDGRLRVHVGMPFGIPCLIRIVGNESIGSNVWRYTAKIIRKPGSDTAATTFKGGLETFTGLTNPEPEIVAYNLCEANNTGSFAGPGYKLPLVQDGFNVLPIGKDRDDILHDVVVQAMLYMGSTGAANRVCAYFCLHNAIDGECDTSAFVEPTYDGGTYTGGV